jgi:hypothetical protein
MWAPAQQTAGVDGLFRSGIRRACAADPESAIFKLLKRLGTTLRMRAATSIPYEVQR